MASTDRWDVDDNGPVGEVYTFGDTSERGLGRSRHGHGTGRRRQRPAMCPERRRVGDDYRGFGDGRDQRAEKKHNSTIYRKRRTNSPRTLSASCRSASSPVLQIGTADSFTVGHQKLPKNCGKPHTAADEKQKLTDGTPQSR